MHFAQECATHTVLQCTSVFSSLHHHSLLPFQVFHLMSHRQPLDSWTTPMGVKTMTKPPMRWRSASSGPPSATRAPHPTRGAPPSLAPRRATAVLRQASWRRRGPEGSVNGWATVVGVCLTPLFFRSSDHLARQDVRCLQDPKVRHIDWL